MSMVLVTPAVYQLPCISCRVPAAAADKMRAGACLLADRQGPFRRPAAQRAVTRQLFGQLTTLACLSCTNRVCTLQGASTSIYAAVAPGLEAHSGAYLKDCAVTQAKLPAEAEAGAKLWELTEQMIAEAMK